MKKKILFLGIVVMLVTFTTICVLASSEYKMTYYSGTRDVVTNLPEQDVTTNGESYNVSSQIPQREGYEFLGWVLDYGEGYKVTYVSNFTDVDDKIIKQAIKENKTEKELQKISKNILAGKPNVEDILSKFLPQINEFHNDNQIKNVTIPIENGINIVKNTFDGAVLTVDFNGRVLFHHKTHALEQFFVITLLRDSIEYCTPFSLRDSSKPSVQVTRISPVFN